MQIVLGRDERRMFLLQTDQTIINKINILDTGIIPKNLDAYKKSFYTLPDVIVLQAHLDEYTPFPDVLLKPYPLVSEMVMHVMRMYRVHPFFRSVLLSKENTKEFKPYFLLYIDEDMRTLFRDFKIKRTSENTFNCIISLDFAESILIRDAQGIELIEYGEQEDIKG